MSKAFLVDTHCLIWFQENNSRLPKKIKELMEDKSNSIYLSQINLFEIAIKQKIGKHISGKADAREVYDAAILDDFIFLAINNHHIYSYQRIPLLEEHRDPFDRLLIATAYEENLIILTNDDKFLLYPDMVKCLW